MYNQSLNKMHAPENSYLVLKAGTARVFPPWKLKNGVAFHQMNDVHRKMTLPGILVGEAVPEGIHCDVTLHDKTSFRVLELKPRLRLPAGNLP